MTSQDHLLPRVQVFVSVGVTLIMLLTVDVSSFPQRKPRRQRVLKPTMATCLPTDVKADEIVVYGFNGTRQITVADKLKDLKGYCDKGRLVGNEKREIRFFRLKCWGYPPPHYLELKAEERRDLELLRMKYTVVVIECDPRLP